MAHRLSAPWNKHLFESQDAVAEFAYHSAVAFRDLAVSKQRLGGGKAKGPAQLPPVVTAGRRKITKAKRERVYKRDGYRCVACGRKDKRSIDHIIPLVHGGSNAESNLQTLCQPCNFKKGDRVV